MNMNIQTDIREYEYKYEYLSHTATPSCHKLHILLTLKLFETLKKKQLQ